MHKGSQSHPAAPTKVPYWVPGSSKRVKNNKLGLEYYRNPGLSLPTFNHRHCCCLILSSCILSIREQANQIPGNITFFSTLPLGRGPTTKHIHPAWLAGKDWSLHDCVPRNPLDCLTRFVPKESMERGNIQVKDKFFFFLFFWESKLAL